MGQRDAANPRKRYHVVLARSQLFACQRARWQGESDGELIYRLISSWLNSDRPGLIQPIEKAASERYSEKVHMSLRPEQIAELNREVEGSDRGKQQVLRDWVTRGAQVAKIETIKSAHDLLLYIEQEYRPDQEYSLRQVMGDLEQVMAYGTAKQWLWQLKEHGDIRLISRPSDTLDFVKLGPSETKYTCLTWKNAASKAS